MSASIGSRASAGARPPAVDAAELLRWATSLAVGPERAGHLAACAAAAAQLQRRHPRHRIVGERELRREERIGGRALASATLKADADGQRRLHRPDLVLWPATDCGELPVAVEVELTVKAPRRLLEICRAWARCELVAGVLYLAAPEPLRALERAIAETRAGERIVVCPLQALANGTDPGKA